MMVLHCRGKLCQLWRQDKAQREAEAAKAGWWSSGEVICFGFQVREAMEGNGAGCVALHVLLVHLSSEYPQHTFMHALVPPNVLSAAAS